MHTNSLDYASIRKYSISEYLYHLGHEIEKKTTKKVWFKNPFCDNQKTTSFAVDIEKNVWCDYAQDKVGSRFLGGSIIDLVMFMHQCNAKDAFFILKRHFEGGEMVSSCMPLQITKKDKTESKTFLQIVDIKPFGTDKRLNDYVLSRKISLDLAKIYLKNVFYIRSENQTTPKNSVGFENDLGGFELSINYLHPQTRQKVKIKNSTKPKTTTLIQGKVGNTVCLFEGFFDFLSCLEYYKTTKLKSDCIILNGCGLVGGVLPNLEKYETINCFFDNDTQSKAGEKAFEQVQNAFGSKAKNQSEIYKGYKDFNDFLCGKPL